MCVISPRSFPSLCVLSVLGAFLPYVGYQSYELSFPMWVISPRSFPSLCGLSVLGGFLPYVGYQS